MVSLPWLRSFFRQRSLLAACALLAVAAHATAVPDSPATPKRFAKHLWHPVFRFHNASREWNDRLALDEFVALRTDLADPEPQVAGQDLIVDTINGNSPYSITANDTWSNVTVGNGATGEIDQTAGTFAVTNTLTVGNNANSNGTYNFSGGSLSASALYVGNSSAGSNTFTQSAGNATISAVTLGYNAGSNGILAISGGSFTTGNFFVGYNGSGTVNQSGGSLLDNTNAFSFYLGAQGTSSNGTYNLSGGSLSVAGYPVLNNASSFTQGGGSSFYSSHDIALNGTSTYSLSGTATLQGSAGLHVNGGTFGQSGGTATFTDIAYIGTGSGGKSTFNLSGGTFTAPGFYVYSGSTANQTGGLLSVTGSTFAGSYFLSLTGGTYNLSGGSLSSGGTVYVSGNLIQSGTSAATFTSDCYIGQTSAGSYSLGDTATLMGKSMYVGYSGKSDQFTQIGGSASFSTLFMGFGSGTNGTFNLSGGTFTSKGVVLGLIGGSGTINETGGLLSTDTTSFAGNNGTYNLRGGTLAASSVTGSSGTGTFNFSGGTLRASAASTTFFQGLTKANFQAGGAVIDSNGFAITITQALLHDTALGAAADGGLTKIGTGALTLTGVNTFTGPTVVNAGTLTLNAGSSSQALGNTVSVTVNAGGTVLLGAANQINSSASLTLNANSGPVAFNTGGFNQSLGTLGLSSSSVINLASGASILRFATSSTQIWTGTLGVWNWTGNAVIGGGADELIFGSDATGLTPVQLSQIVFYSDAGTRFLGTGIYAIGTGEVVPFLPEPSAWVGGALLVVTGACGWFNRRRQVTGTQTR